MRGLLGNENHRSQLLLNMMLPVKSPSAHLSEHHAYWEIYWTAKQATLSPILLTLLTVVLMAPLGCTTQMNCLTPSQFLLLDEVNFNREAWLKSEIETKVWELSNGAHDIAYFYYTDNSDHVPVSWTRIGSVPANGDGLRTLKIEYLLPGSPLQAVYMNLCLFRSQSSCSGGVYDNVNDPVFVFDPASAKETRKPNVVDPLKAMQNTHCEMIGDKGPYEEISVCKWKNGKSDKGGGKGCYPN